MKIVAVVIICANFTELKPSSPIHNELKLVKIE